MTKIFDTPKKDEKVTDYIIAQVRDAILSGKLKPGNRLASEKELTEEFRVSKATAQIGNLSQLVVYVTAVAA